MLLKGSVPVMPSEDRRKVLSCILNLFPNSEIEESGSRIDFISKNADVLIEKLADQQIRDTAVMVLQRAQNGDMTSFYLHKQAAFMGKVNLSDGTGTLGELRVQNAADARRKRSGRPSSETPMIGFGRFSCIRHG